MKTFLNKSILQVTFFALFIAISLNSCQQSTFPSHSSTQATFANMPMDPLNPCDWVGNMHNNAMDYLITHNPHPLSVHQAADTLYNFLHDSIIVYNCVFHDFADTASTFWKAHSLQAWNSIGYTHGRITLDQKTQLNYVANLFDSSDIYDSTSFIHRVYQVEIGINSALTDSARTTVLAVVSIGKASWYYWNYQANNPGTSLWPPLGVKGKGANPAGVGNKVLISALLKADLSGAGASVASDIGTAVAVAVTGVGAAPALGAVAVKAVAMGIIASGIFAIFG